MQQVISGRTAGAAHYTRKSTSAEQESQHTQECTCTYTLKCTLSPYGRVALVKWHLPNVALKHKSSAQHNWLWWSLTAAASDTISALFTHAQTQHIQTPRGEKNYWWEIALL